jgi:hypothetical protein
MGQPVVPGRHAISSSFSASRPVRKPRPRKTATDGSGGSAGSRWSANDREERTRSWVRLVRASTTETRGASGNRLAVTAVEVISPFARPSCAAVSAATGAQSSSSTTSTPAVSATW